MTDEVAELQGTDLPEETTGEDVTEESSPQETEDSSAESQEPKKPRGVQKRIDELTANWREEQRQRQQWEERYLSLEQRLLQQQEPPKPEPQTTQGEPQLDNFDSYEQYIAALADYKADQKIKAWQEQQTQQQTQQQAEQARAAFQTKALEYAAESGLDDFQQVAFSPMLPVSEAMAEVIQQSDVGPQLLYQLGQNPGEAQRISQLPPVQAARELGRMEYQLSSVPPKKQTSAPDPVQPVSGGGGPATLDPDRMSADQWLEWRNNQLRSK